ncbi:programmed cell death 1 ligand 2-like isoform X2 [Nelusetta ayraudi]|uniref:programmed cell death 1 ligand 2-like isoform X2 n=1 Tax=Nelusetta ayraudi TaxID=303726 RepID=UPI003F6EB44D
MDWALLLLLPTLFLRTLSVQLQVEAESTAYEAVFGADVVLACRFQPRLSNPQQNLEVQWHWVAPGPSREVYRLEGQVESQSPYYQGRATLLREHLEDGWIKLKISRLQIGDSGTYQCIVKTDDGADYIETTLSVKAPYKTVSKHLQKAADGEQLLLTCQSEGHPRTAAMWRDGHAQAINSNTSFELTPQQLFRASSQIHVSSALRNNYTCSFPHGGNSATFHITGDVPVPSDGRKEALLVALTVAGLVTAATVATLVHRRRKKSQRNFEGASGAPVRLAQDCGED